MKAAKPKPSRLRPTFASNADAGREVVLLAVTGMAPAILTETIWALAHPRDRAVEPVVPKQVIVVTTAAGKAHLEGELGGPASTQGVQSVWQSLRSALIQGRPERANHLILRDVRVISAANPKTGREEALEDIRSPKDNEAAADFIMEVIRGVVENPDTQLIASLAGGRKTMGALLYGCLSLLGRPQDRLTHVLVNDPFDNPKLDPRFYFPAGDAAVHELKDRAGHVLSRHPANQAGLELADVPFVRLRNLFPSQIGKFPGSFNALVRAYEGQIGQISPAAEVELAKDEAVILVNKTRVEVSGREYALYAYLSHRLESKAPTNIAQKDCLDDLAGWLPKWASGFPSLSFQRDAAAGWKSPTDDDLRKQISSLRGKFKAAGLTLLLERLLPHRGRFGIEARPAR